MSITESLLKTLEESATTLEKVGELKYLPYRLLWGRSLQGYSKPSVQTTLSRAIKKGFVTKKLKKDGVYLALTSSGKDFLDKKVTRVNLTLVTSQKRWDGLYRLIFFDIPESERQVRDLLRTQLKMIGALQWQRSVWVTKENITRQLNDFILEQDLGEFIGVVEVKEIYNPTLKDRLEAS